MKRSVLAVAFLFMVTAMPAQSPDKKPEEKKISGSAIEFSAGPSFVAGTYGSCDKENEKAGYAATGFQASLGFDWMGKKNLGLAFQYSFQRNPLKKAADTVTIPDTKKYLGPGSWSNHYLMAGPVFMKSFNRLLIDGKILAGIVFSASSHFDTPDPVDTTKFNTNVATGFAYQVSVGAGMKVSKRLTLSFRVNLAGGWANVKKQYAPRLIGYETYKDPVTGISYEKPVYSDPNEYTRNKIITSITPTIGLVYHL